MALQIISLRLGTKVISLTSKEFEELKRDMRELDKDHHYYWHSLPYYPPGIRGFSPLTVYGSSAGNSGSLSCNTAGFNPDNILGTPPAFAGSVLSLA